jgi:dynein regulatory complex protein 1
VAQADQIAMGQDELDHLRVKDAEEFNQVKLKLESDIMNLEQDLQRMRATYQLNSEKLEYNLQVC